MHASTRPVQGRFYKCLWAYCQQSVRLWNANCFAAYPYPWSGKRLQTPYLRATTDLDREELRHEGGDRDRLGVKSGGERMAVAQGGGVLIQPGCGTGR
jgi:hypothetical protein